MIITYPSIGMKIKSYIEISEHRYGIQRKLIVIKEIITVVIIFECQ